MKLKNDFVPSGSYVDLSEVSSNLQAMWFVPNTKLDGMNDGTTSTVRQIGGMALVVKFKRGAHYAYAGVPAPLCEAILNGKVAKSTGEDYSIGAAFHQEVISKADIYPYKRLTTDERVGLIGE